MLAAASGTSVSALVRLVEAGYSSNWRVKARSTVKPMVSYSPCGSRAADRSVLPSISSVPPWTGVPLAFWLAASQEMFEVLKLVGLKRLFPEIEPDEVGDAVPPPHAATATAAVATTLTRTTDWRAKARTFAARIFRTIIDPSPIQYPQQEGPPGRWVDP